MKTEVKEFYLDKKEQDPIFQLMLMYLNIKAVAPYRMLQQIYNQEI